MVEQQIGFAETQVNNADGGRVFIKNYFVPGLVAEPDVEEPDDSCADEPESDPSNAAGGCGGVVGVVIVLVVAAVWFGRGLFGGAAADPDAFPTKSDAWPAGATRAAVLTAVNQAWTACAQAVVLNPVNCPQDANDPYMNQVSKVRWTLHGDVTDGARITYQSEPGRFDVLGTAVLSASYRGMYGTGFAANQLYYRAQLSWAKDHVVLATLASYHKAVDKAIVKQDPQVPWELIAPMLGDAFHRCLSRQTLPMGADCPGDSAAGVTDHVTWTGEGDPLANAKTSFDPVYGVTHVVGSFAATARYSVPLFGPTTTPLSGTYDVTIVVDGSKPVVVGIVKK